MKNRYPFNERTDRRSSRQMWMEELERINFDKPTKFYERTEDDYGEESFP